LSDDSEIIGARAKSIAERYGGEITLLHVVEYVPVEPMGEAFMPTIHIETELVDRARTRLQELAAKLGLEHRPQLVETGGIKAKLIRAAQRLDSGLLLLGSREGHGLAILHIFTADALLHSASCDVSAVRLHCSDSA